MLAEINNSYQGKVVELKELGCGKSDEVVAKDQQLTSLTELNDSLKQEVQVLKDNHVWLKKDNQFKTDQLNTFLKDCGTKNEQLYNLRKELIQLKTELKTKGEELAQLQQTFVQIKVNKALTESQLTDVREQIKYLDSSTHIKSQVEATFVKERVNEKLNELHEKLQLENSQLKIDLDDTKARLLISENKEATIRQNYENIVGSLKH